MRFTQLPVLLLPLFTFTALADFDIWETSSGEGGCNGNGCDAPPAYPNLAVLEPYKDPAGEICKKHWFGWSEIENLYCGKKIKFNNGCAVLTNCKNGGEPHGVKTGDFFADLEDCGGGNRGTCFAWHDASTAQRCSPLENRISYSRIACKSSAFNGAEVIGPVRRPIPSILYCIESNTNSVGSGNWVMEAPSLSFNKI